MSTPWFALAPMFLVTAQPGAAADPALTAAQVQQAIHKSIDFLDKDTVRWKDKHKCASCHHAPMMMWAVNEAQIQGYAVNTKSLAAISAWTFHPDNSAGTFPGPKNPPPPDLRLTVPLLTLAVADRKPLEVISQDGVKRGVKILLDQQAADGSWGSKSEIGRPPILDTREVMTLWTTLALTVAPAGQADTDAAKAARAKSQQWLAKNGTPDKHQALALRLLLDVRQGKPAATWAAAVKKLLAQQNADGGWSQVRGMASDAYATGQTLYVLSFAGIKVDDPAIQKGTAFLLKTQKPDGSWPMPSRPVINGSEKPANDLVPIIAAGSAWATLGLVRHWPEANSSP
jgi:hypothetical protein